MMMRVMDGGSCGVGGGCVGVVVVVGREREYKIRDS